MICNSKLVLDLLGENKNLCLRRNIFSLKNLYDIKNGSLTKIAKVYLYIFNLHVDSCMVIYLIELFPPLLLNILMFIFRKYSLGLNLIFFLQLINSFSEY